jgi:hypothetical protein
LRKPRWIHRGKAEERVFEWLYSVQAAKTLFRSQQKHCFTWRWNDSSWLKKGGDAGLDMGFVMFREAGKAAKGERLVRGRFTGGWVRDSQSMDCQVQPGQSNWCKFLIRFSAVHRIRHLRANAKRLHKMDNSDVHRFVRK